MCQVEHSAEGVSLGIAGARAPLHSNENMLHVGVMAVTVILGKPPYLLAVKDMQRCWPQHSK